MMHFCYIKHVLLSPAKCFFLHLEVKNLCAIEKMNDQALIIFHYHIHDMCLWQIDVHACIFQGRNTISFNIIWNDYSSGINKVLHYNFVYCSLLVFLVLNHSVQIE